MTRIHHSANKKIYEINEKSIIYKYRLTFYSYIRLHLFLILIDKLL